MEFSRSVFPSFTSLRISSPKRVFCQANHARVKSAASWREKLSCMKPVPASVVILAGTNDLAQNNGPIATQHIVENIISMAELAMAAGIRPIICSVLPAGKYPWRTEIESVPEKIRDLNARLHRYASDRGLIWVDYYTAMDAGDGSMRSEYTKDGVHPTPEGYDVMERIVLPALAHYCPAAAK